MNEEQIYALMAHAEELQKNAEQSQNDLKEFMAEIEKKQNTNTNTVTYALDKLERLLKEAPENAKRNIIKATLEDIGKPLKMVEVKLAEIMMTSSSKVHATWRFTAACCIAMVVSLSIFFFFGVKLLLLDKKNLEIELTALQEEYDQINKKLSKTANVMDFKERGFWVEIEESEQPTYSNDGRLWAKLPIQK